MRVITQNPFGSQIDAAELADGAVTGAKTATGNRVSLISGHVGVLQGDGGVNVPAAGGFIFPETGIAAALATQTLPSSDTAYSRLYLPRGGKIRRLYLVQLGESGAGDLTCTIYKNGAATTLTATATALGTPVSDLTHEVTVAAGDYLQVFLDHTNVGTVGVSATWVFEYEPTEA